MDVLYFGMSPLPMDDNEERRMRMSHARIRST